MTVREDRRQEARREDDRSERRLLEDALKTFDEGSRLLEQAYRELWTARATERGTRELDVSERIRDLCHEVKNPLGGVRGLASLLDRELASVAGAQRAQRLLAKMIVGLDTAEQILAVRSADDEDKADAGCVAEEICGLALAERHAAGHDVRFRVRAPEGLEVPMPTVRFREVLANLVRNAAEACGAEGTVTVTVQSDLEALVAMVEDDGCGLPEAADTDLFRRGFSTKGTGRGRGLAVTTELVESAGGTLTYGRLASGTIARVRIPRS